MYWYVWMNEYGGKQLQTKKQRARKWMTEIDKTTKHPRYLREREKEKRISGLYDFDIVCLVNAAWNQNQFKYPDSYCNKSCLKNMFARYWIWQYTFPTVKRKLPMRKKWLTIIKINNQNLYKNAARTQSSGVIIVCLLSHFFHLARVSNKPANK